MNRAFLTSVAGLVALIASLMAGCLRGVDGGCLTDRLPFIPSAPNGRGTVEVIDGEGYDTAVVWIAHDRTVCGTGSSVTGAAKVGTEGVWYGVDEDDDGNLMLLVEVNVLESDDDVGWVDCRYVSIIDQTIAFDKEAEQTKVDQCGELEPEDG